MEAYKYGHGRVWFQRRKFVSYELLLPYGITDVSDPVGALNAAREPSASKRGVSVVEDVMRGEPDLPGFSIETTLRRTHNYLLGLNCTINVQAHLGQCGRPDNYFASQIGFHWETCYKGDTSFDRLAQIQGDNARVAGTVPFASRYPFVLVDFTEEFLSARTISETEAVTDMFFLEEECIEDCDSQEDSGENGYAVTVAQSGSPANVANVWLTADRGQTWTLPTVGAFPFGGGEDISCVIAIGRKNDHRVLISRGTADAGNPAEIAYADVTSWGTINWTYVNVGVVNGQYITYMFAVDWTHIYAVTNDGYVYQSTDGGASWSSSLTTAVQQLNDISALRDGTIWVVGNSGTVYMSSDHGVSWTVETDPSGGQNLNTITVTPDGTIFVGSAAGVLYGAYDNVVNADSWSTLTVQGVTATSIVRVRHADDSNIWLVVTLANGSSRTLRSTDGGANFRLWSLNLPTNSGLRALFVVDANLIYVGGDPHGGSAFVTRTNPQVIGF